MEYVRRHLEDKIKRYVRQFPVVVLTGARQAGKSTLLKHLFTRSGWEYVNLDQRGILEHIRQDPDLFVKDISSNVIIDEAQKAPELFHSIKWGVDEGARHKIILSGSANLQLLHKVTETLAGRAGVLELFPLSINEKYNRANILELLTSAGSIRALIDKLKGHRVIDDSNIFEHMLWGGYPKLLEYRASQLKLNWFENYRTVYIERDLRDLSQVADLSDFQRFYQILAFQCAGILNLSNIANDIGITVPTCKKYLQILEATYQYFLLKPYHLNIRKRLIKSPKLYIWDTGLANYFLENSTLKQLKSSGRLGSILENCVIAELLKQNSLMARKSNLYFWRTSNGAEVDLIIEKGQALIPVEIKSSANVSIGSIRGLVDFLKLEAAKHMPFGVVFYRGDKIFRLTEKILAVPVGYI